MKKRSSKKISPKVGDRYQSKFNHKFIVEYLGKEWIVITNSAGLDYAIVGEILRENFTVTLRNYKYLGNYSKTDSFEQLYDLLNDTK